MRGGTTIEIRFGVLEVRVVSLDLFDLENGSARAALAAPTQPTVR